MSEIMYSSSQFLDTGGVKFVVYLRCSTHVAIQPRLEISKMSSNSLAAASNLHISSRTLCDSRICLMKVCEPACLQHAINDKRNAKQLRESGGSRCNRIGWILRQPIVAFHGVPIDEFETTIGGTGFMICSWTLWNTE